MPIAPPRFGAKAPVKAWDHRGKTRQQRGYTAEHDRIRKQLLADEPLCRECVKQGRVKAAVIADHIIPLSACGKTVRANYQPLCRACSDAKTKLEASRAWRG